MKLNKIFQTTEVPIPDRSGFDLGREHLFTAPVGTLVPAECIEVLPNDTISVGAMQKVTLPPFAVPFMGRIDACMEAFFVPNRILWKGWQAFITQNSGVQNNTNVPTGTVPLTVPLVDISDNANRSMMGVGTLSDYLGYSEIAQPSSQDSISALKFLAYHKIVDEWYRDQNNMKPFFAKNITYYSGAQIPILPHTIDSISSAVGTNLLTLTPASVGGGSNYDNLFDTSIGLGSLRQRCWAKDYFTTATTRPQAGDAAQITFATNAATGNITVADIRAASALQRWLERNNISGTDYGSQILAHFGVTPPDSVLNKPVLLGAIREPVYVGSVENNSNAEITANSTSNPFGTTLGSAAGFGSSFGKGSLVNSFHAKEHGFIMIMFSLVPHAYYNTGIERELYHKKVGDFAWPEYAHIGDQAILTTELYPGQAGSDWGYTQRFAEYKCRIDKISGKLRDGQNLSVYALQRGFTNNPSLGKQFLEIPVNYLDQVSQADFQVSLYGCMVDAFFDTRAIRLLPEYSLPKIL